MTDHEAAALQSYVGQEETRSETVCETAVRQFRSTFEDRLVSDSLEIVPPGFHWILFPPLTRSSELGEDGHPKALGLLPEMSLPSRMWAGGEVIFRGALRIGDTVDRHTKVEGINAKSGASGPLLFVTLLHEACVGGQTVVSERQNLVYRNPVTPPATRKNSQERSKGEVFKTDSRLLFRYSALTFNSHRIHYDRDYARDREGYPDLVVHGPLQATLLVNHLAKSLGHARIGMRYRGVAPLYVTQEAYLCRTEGDSGDAWIERSPGDVTMKARFGPVSDFF